MNRMEELNTKLIQLFHEYLQERPELLDQIPDDAVLVMQLHGDEVFNRWSRKISEEEGQEGWPVVYVEIALKPQGAKVLTVQAIEKLELQPIRL
ncbi:MAG: DUF5647 family protein [Candidatus Bipolaricaulia bacterium]